MINIYYGKNGVCKTRYLEKLKNYYLSKNYRVITNLPNINGSSNSFNFAEDPELVNKLKYTEIYQMIRNNHLQEKFLTTDAINTAKLLCYRGDVLLVDGIETIFTKNQVCEFCNGLKSIQDEFKEIHIATHSPILREMFYNKDHINFYICRDISQEPELIPMEDIYDCDINDFIKRG